jgi:hypothetical protein
VALARASQGRIAALAPQRLGTKFGTRFTFAPVPRQEVLDRLMELNHERYAEEVRRGQHGKPKAKPRPIAAAAALSFDVGDA